MNYRNFNYKAAKAILPHEARDPPLATYNCKVCEPNYNNYSRKRKPPSHKCKGFRLSRELTQGSSNEQPPRYRIEQTPLQPNKHSYSVASAANWINYQDPEHQLCIHRGGPQEILSQPKPHQQYNRILVLEIRTTLCKH